MPGPAADHCIEDPFAFAVSAGLHEGRIPVAMLVRLRDRLAGQTGSVDFVLRGGHDDREQPLLELEITGNLCLRCDRCLDILDFPLSLHTRVLLAHTGAIPESEDDPDALEWIEANGELDVWELVEDELVLGLPLSVRHAQGECANEVAGAQQTGTAKSPFSKLADLLNVDHKKSQ